MGKGIDSAGLPNENRDRDLADHKDLLEIISRISFQFISSPSQDIDLIINDSLKKIGIMENIDRSYIFLFDDKFADNTHEWCNAGIRPLKNSLQRIPLESMPWCTGQLKKYNIIYIPDVSGLVQSPYHEKSILEKQGIKSILIIPMMFQNRLVGFLGFDSVKRNKYWREDIIRFLRLLGDIVINTVERSKMQGSLIRANKNLKTEISKATKRLISVNKSLEEEINERRQVEHKILTRDKRLINQNAFILDLISGESVYRKDLKEAYNLITRITADIMNTDRVSIWLLNGNKDELSCQCMYNRFRQENFSKMKLRSKDNPIYFDSLLRGNIIRAADAAGDPITKSFQNAYFSKDNNVKSLLDCPIFLNNDVIGLLSVHTLQEKTGWSNEDINFVTSLAAIISLCIENRERQKAQKELTESEVKYKLLFDGSVDSIFILENDRFIECNAATEKMFLCRRSEILGKSPFDFSPDKQPDGSSSKEKGLEMIRLAYEGQHQVFEWTHCRLDKTQFVSEISLKKFELYGKTLLQAVVRDITENKNLQKRLFTTQKLESLGKLAGGIAHDFNNILGVIMGYASILAPKISSDGQMTKYLNSIINESKRASELIRRLLAFSQGGSTEFRVFDLSALISEISDIIKHTFDKNISFHCNMPKKNILINGDYTQLHQVFMNIVINARDAMPNGGILTIDGKIVNGINNKGQRLADSEEDYIKICIRDSGIGMDKHTMDCIFDPFFTTKRPGKGIGLGLSAVYGIVNIHKGFIDVESEKDIGTAITVMLPVSKNLPLPDRVEKPGEKIKSGTETIMIVDDEKEILNLSRDIFSMHGYNVLLANGGNEAVDMYKKNNIDLVVMDMMMPKMSGNELYFILKDINPDIRVIISSGFSKESILETILKEKNCRFIQKPFTIDSLLSLVRECLD